MQLILRKLTWALTISGTLTAGAAGAVSLLPGIPDSEACKEVERRVLSMAYRERAEMPGRQLQELLEKRDFKAARAYVASYQTMYQDYKDYLLKLPKDQYDCVANDRIKSFGRDDELARTEEALRRIESELERIAELDYADETQADESQGDQSLAHAPQTDETQPKEAHAAQSQEGV